MGTAMSDLIDVQPGQPFWQPTPETEINAVFDLWDVPQSGLISSCGLAYLFVKIRGGGSIAGLCVYVRVDDDQIALLDSLAGDQLRAAIDALILGDRVVAAATYEHRLLLGVVVEQQETIEKLTLEAFAHLSEEINRRRDDEDAWLQTLASIAV
jgi:hypothetical protein